MNDQINIITTVKNNADTDISILTNFMPKSQN